MFNNKFFTNYSAGRAGLAFSSNFESGMASPVKKRQESATGISVAFNILTRTLLAMSWMEYGQKKSCPKNASVLQSLHSENVRYKEGHAGCASWIVTYDLLLQIN